MGHPSGQISLLDKSQPSRPYDTVPNPSPSESAKQQSLYQSAKAQERDNELSSQATPQKHKKGGDDTDSETEKKRQQREEKEEREQQSYELWARYVTS